MLMGEAMVSEIRIEQLSSGEKASTLWVGDTSRRTTKISTLITKNPILASNCTICPQLISMMFKILITLKPPNPETSL